MQQALQPLVDMLLKLLSKQEEGQDEDDGIWNLSLAGGNCLSLVAAVVGDEVLALVMPYIQVCTLTCNGRVVGKVPRIGRYCKVLATLCISPGVYSAHHELPAPGKCKEAALGFKAHCYALVL